MKKNFHFTGILLALAVCLSGCEPKISKELNQKLSEEHQALIKEQSILADEHSGFEKEIKEMETEYYDVVETPDSLYTFNLKNHKNALAEHGKLLEQHREILKQHTAIVEKHASQKIMDEEFQKEHAQLMDRHNRMKAEHDKIKMEHEKFEKEHRIIIDSYPPEKRKKKTK
jgi:hypothetical protein